ncbi:MAG: hypothetical protein AAF560_16105 [Acidobacteriota bacterium]
MSLRRDDPGHNPTRVEVVNLKSDGRPQYRLGDAILKRDERYGRQALSMVANAKDCFEGTILYEYARRIDRDSSDPQWPVLFDVVRRKIPRLAIARPAEDELVAHLRLGNVKGYHYPATDLVDYVAAVLDHLPAEVARVSLVTAVHFGQGYLDQHDGGTQLQDDIAGYREKVAEILSLFGERGIEAKLVSHPDADTDFCYLAQAQTLILGNGHFSLCAAMISGAWTFVPPWATRGTYVDVGQLLGSRDPSMRL